MCALALLVCLVVLTAPAEAAGLQSADLLRLRSVVGVQFSLEGRRLAYVIENNDQPGRAYSQLWIMDISTANSTRVGGERSKGAAPEWSPDGRSVAYIGSDGEKSGLMVANADGSAPVFLAEM